MVETSKAVQRQKIFLLIMAIIFTDTLLYGAIVPLIPVYTQQYSFNSLTMGLVFSIYSLGLLVFSIPMGIIAEKYGYQRVLGLGMLGLGLVTMFYGQVHAPWQLLVARLMQGSAGAVSWTAGLALVALLFPRRQGEKLGVVMAAMGLGSMLGPPVGGALYNLLGYSHMFTGLALFCLLLGFLIFRLDFGGLVQGVAATAARGFSMVRLPKDPGLFWLGLVIVVVSSSLGMLEILLPNYYNGQFGLGILEIGLVFGVMGLVHAFSDIGIGYLSDRLGYPPFIFWGLLAGALCLPLVALAPVLPLSVLAVILAGVAAGAVLTPSQPLMYRLVSSRLEPDQGSGAGLAYGITNTCFSLGLLIGPTLGGALDNYLGLLASFVVFALLYLVVALAFRFLVLRRGGLTTQG